MPPPLNDEAQAAHLALLANLEILSKPRSFRSPHWKPSARRNKNIKQIIAEAQRREATTTANSAAATAAASAAATPLGNNSGANTPVANATQSLSGMVLERNLQARLAAAESAGAGAGSTHLQSQSQTLTPIPTPLPLPQQQSGLVTYTSLEAAPSLHPAHARPYCDITGLPAQYRDPKSRLRYHNREVYAYIRSLPPGVAEAHLAARGANVILK